MHLKRSKNVSKCQLFTLQSIHPCYEAWKQVWRREEECFRVTADFPTLYAIWIAACLGQSLCLFEYEELAAYRARAVGLHADRHSPRHHPAKQDWPGWCSVAMPAVPPPLHRRCRLRACFTLTAGLSCVRYDNSVSSQKKTPNMLISAWMPRTAELLKAPLDCENTMRGMPSINQKTAWAWSKLKKGWQTKHNRMQCDRNVLISCSLFRLVRCRAQAELEGNGTDAN